MSWLWKNDASSPASFEKALSKLSSQITAANLSLEGTRSRGRRLKALWTLYSTGTYLIFLLILVLVIGPQDWSIPHYGGLLGGPVTIYGVRRLIASLFDWRAGRQQAHVNQLSKQREVKISDLKKATKWDTTQELLQKYGGGPPPSKETSTKQSPQSAKGKPKQPAEHAQRTGLPPPPTANIQGRQPQQPPMTPPPRPSSRGSLSTRSPPQTQSPVDVEEPGFAPNAFIGAQHTRANYEQTPHWYDRILDVMLGEDENLAKNRLVLLCQNCRLVNGQAPPGVKTLEQMGKWRCGSCGAWNGTESEGAKVVREMVEQPKLEASDEWQQVSRGDGVRHETEQIPSEDITMDTGRGTGKATGEDAGITKRATRSSGQEPVEGL